MANNTQSTNTTNNEVGVVSNAIKTQNMIDNTLIKYFGEKLANKRDNVHTDLVDVKIVGSAGTTVPYKQIIIAAGAGATAALSAFDHLIRSTAPA